MDWKFDLSWRNNNFLSFPRREQGKLDKTSEFVFSTSCREERSRVRLEKSLSFVFSTLRREEIWRKHILTIFWLFHVKQRGKSAHAGLPHLRHTSGVNFILQIAAIILLFLLLIVIIKSCCSKNLSTSSEFTLLLWICISLSNSTARQEQGVEVCQNGRVLDFSQSHVSPTLLPRSYLTKGSLPALPSLWC